MILLSGVCVHRSGPGQGIVKYLFFFFFITFSLLCRADDFRQVVAGAGPSTQLVKLFFHELGKQVGMGYYEFIVPDRSIKHAGGIKASGEYIFGRTGRPLSDEEKRLGKNEIILAGIPLVFVTGQGVAVKSLSYQQIESIYTKKIINWKSIAGIDAEISLVGREATEASLSIMKQVFPFMAEANYDIEFSRDHRVVNYIASRSGDYAIAFGAMPNFDRLNVVQVEGYRPHMRVGLVYDIKNSGHSLVKKVSEFANTDRWREIVEENGYLVN